MMASRVVIVLAFTVGISGMLIYNYTSSHIALHITQLNSCISPIDNVSRLIYLAIIIASRFYTIIIIMAV